MTESVRNRFKVYSILFSAVVIGGTAGIMAAEDLSFLNAFYFMIVTMATVGYGDVHPVTPAGKILTILIIITGVGTFVGAIANATEFMLVRRDMQVRMNKLNMVIGVFFSEVGLRLLAGGHPRQAHRDREMDGPGVPECQRRNPIVRLHDPHGRRGSCATAGLHPPEAGFSRPAP